jgi:O-antigen/teichoic acid export membrane protein
MLRSAVTISSGHLAAQLLMVLGAPALSRLYRPEDFNVLGVYVALLTVLGPLITLRFEPALMLIGRPRHGAVHAGGVMLLSGLTSLLAAGTIWLLQRPLRPWLAMDLSPQLCAAVALGFWAFACYQVSSMLLIRRGEFRRLAQQRVIYSAATLGAQLWLGWRTPSPWRWVTPRRRSPGCRAFSRPGVPSAGESSDCKRR